MFYTTFLSEIIPLIFCILFFKKLNTRALKVFFVYTCMLCVFSILAVVALKIFKDRQVYFFVARSYNIIEFTVISFFLYYVFRKTLVKKLVLFFILPFIIYAAADYLINDRTHFNNHSNIVSALLLIAFLIYFFFEKMKTVVMYPLYQTITFWICVAFFLYFTGAFFFILFITSSTDIEFARQMNTIYGVVTITKNILLCLSLLASESVDQQISDELHIPTEVDLGEFSLTTLKNS